MQPLRFRSSLLSPMPIDRAEGRAGRVSRRLMGLGILAAVVAGLILVIALRALPPRGLGYLLYWLHDFFYLWWKGYFLTQYFPDSLIWWGALTMLLTLWLLTYVTDRSLVRQPQIALIRWCLKRPRLYPLLRRSAAWLTRLRIRPGLLLAVIAQERTAVHSRVITAPLRQAAARDCAYLLDLTMLLLDLMALPPTSDATNLEAAAHWHEAFLSARVYGTASDHRIQDKLERLAGRRQPLLAAFPPESGVQPFSPAALAADLDLMVKLWESRSRSDSHDSDGQMQVGLMHLAGSLQRRQRLLLNAYACLELREVRARPDAAQPSLGLEAISALNAEALADLGRLALGLSLDLAQVADAPELALGYLDALEALHFALALAPEGRYPLLAAVIADLPRPQDYALVAQLASQRLRQRLGVWQSLIEPNEGPLRSTDFRQASAQLVALAHAAGPTPFATDELPP